MPASTPAAAAVDDAAVTAEDHEQVRRRSLDRAWHNDLAVAALSAWVADESFVVGGDWNTAILWDTLHPAEGASAAEFFGNRASKGWHDALRKFSPEEVRTSIRLLSLMGSTAFHGCGAASSAQPVLRRRRRRGGRAQ